MQFPLIDTLMRCYYIIALLKLIDWKICHLY